jgi:hypothetical protein
MVPEELYFQGNYTEEPFILSNSYTFNKTKTDEYYISVIPTQKVNDELAYLKIDLSIKIQSQSLDTSKIPLLTFQLLDDQIQNHRWLQFRWDTITYPGNDFRLQLRKYIDLTMVRDLGSKTMKLYLLNTEKQPLVLDSMKLDISKIKLKNKIIKR